MQKSIFFRRVLSLLLLALLLWVILTALIYSFVSRPIFIKIKVDEIQKQADFIAGLAPGSILSDNPSFKTLLNSVFQISDAWIYVIEGLSGEIFSSPMPEEMSAVDPMIRAQISSRMPALMSGSYSSLYFTSHIQPAAGATEVLFVGVPVTVEFNGQRQVIGAVFFVKPLDELNAGLSSLNIAVLTSSLLVLLLMILPVYIATARLIRPLRQTRDVALAMSEGNFSVRADTRQKGEIGELAATMNDLAGELEANLSALTMERNRLRQIITGMNDGLVAVDQSNQITEVNPAFCSLLRLDSRFEPAEDKFSWPEDLQELAAAFQSAVGENQPVSLGLAREDRQISCKIVPLSDESGMATGAVGLFADITESERLEQTRRDYVANISHELRTPLTAMRALIEPLRDGMVHSEEDRNRYYGIMLRESIRLSRLIDDMLELSRLQAGTMQIPRIEFELQPILGDLAMKSRKQIDEAGLVLTMPVNLAECPPVSGDPDRIEEVLVILLDNAIKYTSPGGSISFRLNWSITQVQVSVQDTGVGISSQDIPHVFERFYKVDKSHQQPGTGLGLSIAKEIILRLAQTIQVRSEPGRGSVFTFTLDRSVPPLA